MVQIGFSMPVDKSKATPIAASTIAKKNPSKMIPIDKLFETAKVNGIDKLEPMEANQKMDSIVDSIRNNGGDVIGWDAFKEVHTGFSNKQEEPMGVGEKIGIGAGIGAGTVAGAYAIGKPSQKLGEAIYGAAFGNTATAASQDIRGGKPESIAKSAIETPGVWGTETRLGQKAYQGQQKLWSKEVAPYIKDTINVTTADELGNDIISSINKGKFSASKKAQLLTEAKTFVTDLKKTYPKGINQNEAHLLTSERGKDLEAVFKKVGKDVAATPVTNEAKGILLEGRGLLRNKLIKSMSSNAGVEGVTEEGVKKAMVKYGNLGKVVAQSEKDLQQRLLGSVLGASSAVLKKGGTPAVTILGKGLYNVGKVLSKPAEKAVELIGKGAKIGKALLKDTAGLLAPDLLETTKQTKAKVSKTLPEFLKKSGVNIPQ